MKNAFRKNTGPLFLETGGTPGEWAEHNIRITVGYEIKQQSDKYLSFVVRGTENWTNAYSDSKYYNLKYRKNRYIKRCAGINGINY